MLKIWLIFKDKKTLSRIISNSFWMFLDKVLRLGLTVLIGAWIARHLGPTEYGQYAYVIAYIALFQSVTTLGLDGISVRDISQNPEKTSTILGTLFIMRLTVGFTCWILAIIGMYWLHGLDNQSLILTFVVGGSLVFQAADTVDIWFQSQSQSRRTLNAKLCAYIISNGAKIFLILNGGQIFHFALAVLFESVVSAIGLSYAYRKFNLNMHLSYANSVARKMLIESWPYIVSGMATAIYMRFDQIIIKEALGLKSLGIYAAILPISNAAQVIPMILNSSLAPILAIKKKRCDTEYWVAIERIFNIYALIGWLGVAFIQIFSPILIPIMYGSEYQDGSFILSIHIFGFLFICMGLAQGLWILNERKALITLIGAINGAAVSIIGNILLIEKFGLAGVALVSILAQFTSCVLTNALFSKKIFLIQTKSIFWPIHKLLTLIQKSFSKYHLDKKN